MEGEILDFGDTFNASDPLSVCSKNKSRDLLVKFSDKNIVSHKEFEIMTIS